MINNKERFGSFFFFLYKEKPSITFCPGEEKINQSELIAREMGRILKIKIVLFEKKRKFQEILFWLGMFG
jgi:hypothetical protein